MEFIHQFRQLNRDNTINRVVSEHDAVTLYQFLDSVSPLDRTFQKGLGFGELALAVISVTNKLHIVADAFQVAHQYYGIRNLKSINSFELIDFRDDFSYAVLPKLLEGNYLVDFAILDSDENFDYLINDFVNIDLISKKGAYLLIRKTSNQNNILFHQYLKTNRPDYNKVELQFDGFILFQKIERDKRPNNFFEKLS